MSKNYFTNKNNGLLQFSNTFPVFSTSLCDVAGDKRHSCPTAGGLGRDRAVQMAAH